MLRNEQTSKSRTKQRIEASEQQIANNLNSDVVITFTKVADGATQDNGTPHGDKSAAVHPSKGEGISAPLADTGFGGTSD